MTRAFVGLGSNVGDRRARLNRAVTEMAGIPATRVVAVSSCYDTDPVGDADFGPYLNAVVELDTQLGAEPLWTALAAVESGLGRPKTGRWGSRTIDIDLLYHGESRLDGELKLPHPRLAERLFVLVPMTELAPRWRDPRLGLRMDELLRERSKLGSVRWAGRLDRSG